MNSTTRILWAILNAGDSKSKDCTTRTLWICFDRILLLLPHSAPSWILSLAENLASSNLQDGATKWHYCSDKPPGHPPGHPPAALVRCPPLSFSSVLSFCAVSPPLSLNSVRCPHPSLNIWPQFHVRCPPQFWVICGVMCSNICFLILCGVPTPLRSSCQITISWMCDVPLPLTPETLLSTQCPPPSFIWSV
mgnify:CR=1 FL=1